jgi:hypothetical protein
VLDPRGRLRGHPGRRGRRRGRIEVLGDDVPAAAHGRQQAIVRDDHRSCSFQPVGREVDERGYARCFSLWTDLDYPRLQLRTIADLLDGRGSTTR